MSTREELVKVVEEARAAWAAFEASEEECAAWAAFEAAWDALITYDKERTSHEQSYNDIGTTYHRKLQDNDTH